MGIATFLIIEQRKQLIYPTGLKKIEYTSQNEPAIQDLVTTRHRSPRLDRMLVLVAEIRWPQASLPTVPKTVLAIRPQRSSRNPTE